MCAKRPSPKHELPITPEDCTLLADAMVFMFEQMDFDLDDHGIDYDCADAACELLRSRETIFTLLQTQAIVTMVQQTIVRFSAPGFRCPDLEKTDPELMDALRSSLPRLSELSSLLAGYAKPPRHK